MRSVCNSCKRGATARVVHEEASVEDPVIDDDKDYIVCLPVLDGDEYVEGDDEDI